MTEIVAPATMTVLGGRLNAPMSEDEPTVPQRTYSDQALEVGSDAAVGFGVGKMLSKGAKLLGKMWRRGAPSPSKQNTVSAKHGTRQVVWQPSETLRIRFESHPADLVPGGKVVPRHHGPHYHIETKPAGMSWNKAKKKGLIQKDLG